MLFQRHHDECQQVGWGRELEHARMEKSWAGKLSDITDMQKPYKSA